MIEHIRKGAVLAPGAGDGSLRLASLGFSVAYVGESSVLVDRAAQLGLPVSFALQPLGTYEPTAESVYDAVVVLGQLHFLPLEFMGQLVASLQKHAKPGGYPIIRALGRQAPREGDRSKTSLLPWPEWYSDWRIIELTHQHNEIRSRHAGSSHWLFTTERYS